MRHVLSLLIAGVFFAVGTVAGAQGRITVTGRGEVSRAPDMAVIRLGASFEAETAGESVDLVAEALDGTIAALKAVGVADRAIQTQELSLFPLYGDRSYSGPRVANGFRASSGLSVRVSDLDRLRDLLDAVLDEGANEFGGITFAIADSQPDQDQARVAAIADARRKAAIMAEAAGVSLGPILSIRETGTGGGPGPVVEMMESRAAMPVAAGEDAVSAVVTIEWEIVQGTR